MVGDCCAKVVIIIVNVFFLLIGLVVSAVGAVLIAGRSFLSPFLESFVSGLDNVAANSNLETTVVTDTTDTVASFFDIFQNFAIALIVLGVGIIAVSILGMCGSCCSVKIMLIVYVVIVLVVFLAHAIVFGCLMLGVFGGEIKGALVTGIKKEYGGISSTTPQSLLFNFMMIRYECCGVNDFGDFENSEKWENELVFEDDSGNNVTRTLLTPIACCVTEGDFPDVTPVEDECSYLPTDANNNWKTGCWDALDIALVDPNKSLVIGVNCGILVFELILAALTIFVLVMKDKAGIMPV